MFYLFIRPQGSFGAHGGILVLMLIPLFFWFLLFDLSTLLFYGMAFVGALCTLAMTLFLSYNKPTQYIILYGIAISFLLSPAS